MQRKPAYIKIVTAGDTIKVAAVQTGTKVLKTCIEYGDVKSCAPTEDATLLEAKPGKFLEKKGWTNSPAISIPASALYDKIND